MVILHVHLTPFGGKLDGMAWGSQKFESMAYRCELNFQWHIGHE
jgi:hypothetical protein